MPLDGHAHLVAQGWSGKGNGLRNGAITKPVTVVQKKTLAGIGKDRDEAFPFWDHVFQAAAVSISVKVHNSDDESDKSDSEGSTTPALSLKRTSTGIISNRRPTTGTPALSGTTTPSESQASGSVTPRLSIMAAAKQQAARRMLYSMFYRGPVLTNEEKSGSEEPASVVRLSSPASPRPRTRETVRSKDNKSMSKKRKAEREDEEEDKQERKRRKREAKEKDGKSRSKSKGKGKGKEMEMVAVVGTHASDANDDEDEEVLEDSKASKAARKAERAERKRWKAERRARKEERRNRKLERKAAKIKGAETETESDEGDSCSQDTAPIDRSAATGTSSASPRHTKVKRKGKKS
ncbi:hypothetical protein C8Q74DRAFT_1276001 [Fomes fomentarius]|nr:hypothetical protein C8Q74DRAFT_1276001 [Fomes fomentarius]